MPASDPSLAILGADDEAGTTFVDITDGAVRPLIHGMQNGFHVWMNVRLRGVCPYQVQLTRSITDVATGHLLIAQAETATFPPLPGDATTFSLPAAFAFFLCPNTDGQQVRDRLVRVDMRVVDRKGRTATSSVNIVPQCMMTTQGGVYYDDCQCTCGPATDASCPQPMIDASE